MTIGEITARDSGRKRRSVRRRRWLTIAVLLVAAAGDGGAAGDRLPAVLDVDVLHEAGLTGHGVTVAVVDGGAGLTKATLQAADGHHRLLAVFDARAGTVLEAPGSPDGRPESGTPATALEAMLSSGRDADGRYRGVAPNADLVLLAGLDATDAGGALGVARGVDWVVANRDRYGIRVLVLPLAAPPSSRFGEDPVGDAVMKAWQAGIVVVAVAGGLGPGPASVSAAAAAGVATLAVEHSPWLAPDDVKPRLLSANGTRLWSAGELRGFVWSDLAGRGFVWSDFSARGFVWSDFDARGLTWSELAARGITWSD